MALHVAILVENVTIFIDLVTDQFLGITFDKLADDVTIFVLDHAALNNMETLVASKGSFGTLNALTFRNELATTSDLSGVVVDKTFSIRSATSKVLKVTLDKLTHRSAVWSYQVTLFVED